MQPLKSWPADGPHRPRKPRTSAHHTAPQAACLHKPLCEALKFTRGRRPDRHIFVSPSGHRNIYMRRLVEGRLLCEHASLSRSQVCRSGRSVRSVRKGQLGSGPRNLTAPSFGADRHVQPQTRPPMTSGRLRAEARRKPPKGSAPRRCVAHDPMPCTRAMRDCLNKLTRTKASLG